MSKSLSTQPPQHLPTIQFLSQNRPSALMGMGHYERLLFTHLLPLASQQFRFGITFSGRGDNQSLEPEKIAPGLSQARYLGISTERLFDCPWPLAKAVVRRQLGAGKPALYHSLSAGFPAPEGARIPGVYYIHDLPPARFDDEGRIPRWTKQATHSARLILTPSQFAKDELIELLELPEEKVRVVRYGCEHENFHPGVAAADADVLEKLNVKQPFLLYAGGFTRRKNVPALLQAWQSLAPEYSGLSLVLAGPPEQLQAHVEKNPAPRVVVAGYLDRVTLSAMMKVSQALVFPSIYEGFGLPPLEALALGVPVIAVRAGAIPEVVGGCAELAESGAPEDLVTAIRNVLDDRAATQERTQQGLEWVHQFSWSNHVRQILKAYEDVLG